MKADEITAIPHPLGYGRRVSFGLYIAAAFAFAGIMLLIGAIPQGGGGTAIRYQSFGQLAVALVFVFLFREGGFLGRFPLPDWPWLAYAPFVLLAACYCLLVTMPLYFYLRTRRAWLLFVQMFTLALHAAFAVFVVAPFWIHQ
jgi:hypothetical protein